MIPILLLFFSFSTVRLQVVFGLPPLLFFLSGAHVIAMLQSLFWSCLSICPIIFHQRRLTSLLIGFISALVRSSSARGNYSEEARKGFLILIVCLNDEILKNDATMIWTTFEYLYDAIIRQYFKGAYDVLAITMATGQLSEESL